MENTVVISSYLQMDRVNKENRQYILRMLKKIKSTGCNVLLIQKSIAVDDTALAMLAHLKMVVIKDIEWEEIEFLSKTLNCKPISDIEAFTADKLGYADVLEEESISGARVVTVKGIKNMGPTVSIIAFGANKMVTAENERSLHDALCVVRCLVNNRSVCSTSPQ